MDYVFLAALVGIVMFADFIGSMMSGGSIIVFTVLTVLDIPAKTAIGTLKIVITVLGQVSAFTFFKGGAVNLEAS